MRHPAFHVRGCVPVCVLSTSIMAAAGGGEGEAVSSQAAADAVLAMASFGCVLFATPAQRAAHYRLIPAITDGMLLAALEERWGRVWPSLRADVDKARGALGRRHWLSRMFVLGVALPDRSLVTIQDYLAVLGNMGVPAARTQRAENKAVCEALLRGAVEEAALGTVHFATARVAAAMDPTAGPVLSRPLVFPPPASAGHASMPPAPATAAVASAAPVASKSAAAAAPVASTPAAAAAPVASTPAAAAAPVAVTAIRAGAPETSLPDVPKVMHVERRAPAAQPWWLPGAGQGQGEVDAFGVPPPPGTQVSPPAIGAPQPAFTAVAAQTSAWHLQVESAERALAERAAYEYHGVLSKRHWVVMGIFGSPQLDPDMLVKQFQHYLRVAAQDLGAWFTIDMPGSTWQCLASLHFEDIPLCAGRGARQLVGTVAVWGAVFLAAFAEMSARHKPRRSLYMSLGQWTEWWAAVVRWTALAYSFARGRAGAVVVRLRAKLVSAGLGDYMATWARTVDHTGAPRVDMWGPPSADVMRYLG